MARSVSTAGMMSPRDLRRPSAEDLALDVSRLMDNVREEVMALMQDSMQKAASFCASLCAERIVAARRELQRRWAEERRELERLYSIQGPPGNGMSSKVAGFLPFVPEPSPALGSAASFGCMSPASASNYILAAPPSESFDASFIDAYDAVQTLEERTNLAFRAMDLLDEALQVAGEAGCGGAAATSPAPSAAPARERPASASAVTRRPPPTTTLPFDGRKIRSRPPSAPSSPDSPESRRSPKLEAKRPEGRSPLSPSGRSPLSPSAASSRAPGAVAGTPLSPSRAETEDGKSPLASLREVASSSWPAPSPVAEEPATSSIISPSAALFAAPLREGPLPTLAELASGTRLPVFENRGGEVTIADQSQPQSSSGVSPAKALPEPCDPVFTGGSAALTDQSAPSSPSLAGFMGSPAASNF